MWRKTRSPIDGFKAYITKKKDLIMENIHDVRDQYLIKGWNVMCHNTLILRPWFVDLE